MSSYKVISEVSTLLQQALWTGYQNDPALNAHVQSIEAIVLLNPGEVSNEPRRVSLWLYQVQQNEYLRNTRPARVPDDDDRVRYPALALNLFYLLTPSTGDVMADQLVLGRSMQIFHDNPTLLLVSAQNDEEQAEAEELRISLCQRDLRELAEVWEALQQPYRLSVCYEVRVPRIESTRFARTGRIDDRQFDFHEPAIGAAP